MIDPTLSSWLAFALFLVPTFLGVVQMVDVRERLDQGRRVAALRWRTRYSVCFGAFGFLGSLVLAGWDLQHSSVRGVVLCGGCAAVGLILSTGVLSAPARSLPPPPPWTSSPPGWIGVCLCFGIALPLVFGFLVGSRVHVALVVWNLGVLTLPAAERRYHRPIRSST
jgi:hypothetical protein